MSPMWAALLGYLLGSFFGLVQVLALFRGVAKPRATANA